MFLVALSALIGCGILIVSKRAIKHQPIEADPVLEHAILASFADDPAVVGQLHTVAWHPDVLAKTKLTVPVAVPGRNSKTWGKLVEFKWHRDHRWNAGKMVAVGDGGVWSYSYKLVVGVFLACLYTAAFYNSVTALGVGVGVSVLNVCLHSEIDRITGYVSDRSWVLLNTLATVIIAFGHTSGWVKAVIIAGAVLLPVIPTGPVPKGDVYLGWAGGVLPGVILQSVGYAVAAFTLASTVVVVTWLAVRVFTKRPVLAIPFGVGWPVAVLACTWLPIL